VTEIFTFSRRPRPNHHLNRFFMIAKVLGQIVEFEYE